MMPTDAQGRGAAERAKKFAEFLREHVFEILTGVVLALVAAYATASFDHLKDRIDGVDRRLNEKIENADKRLTEKIADLDKRVKDFECDALASTSNRELELIDVGLGMLALADVSLTNRYVVRLAALGGSLARQLGKCPERAEVVSRIKLLQGGIEAYTGHDFSGAIAQFDRISPKSSLVLRFLAVSLLTRAQELRSLSKSLDDPMAKETQIRGEVVLRSALLLIRDEQDRISKERIIAHLVCAVAGMPRSDAGNEKQIKCFKGLLDRGAADHNTFYNLAAVYARVGEFESSVTMLGRCLEANGKVYVAKRYIDDDEDFKVIRVDKVWGPKFILIANEFE